MNSDSISFRNAFESDLPAIVSLLADDQLGAHRETFGEAIATEYSVAFSEIESDPNNEILVAVLDNRIVGVLQLTFIPNLTHRGTRRAMIEGVRIAADYRSQGLGSKLVNQALERCRSRECWLVQLTSDLERTDAIAFYEKMGFRHSHAGLKLWLKDA